ncbi:Shugoshin C-terminal domain-containing protein [Madurella fahalii]|uniref:Shugoshin C-terminal domain-containing protein n=1 Tax=Madurella fahalii TaxID=1157608 RepID=A0ABQ0G9D6_9PEZI
MSLADQPLPAREAGHPIDMTDARTLKGGPNMALSSQPAAFDEPIFDKFYDMDNHAPELPKKSALRASRFLDNHGLKLGGAVEAAELGQATTPHDVYLSSEEDASSDADDFSDYDYDSSVDDHMSPTRQSSHEDMARVVSVVFSGKPSIVNLSGSRKRPVSSISTNTTRTRSSTDSTASAGPSTTVSSTTEDRPTTPASSTYSQSQSQQRPNNDRSPNRKSTLLSEILVKKKPPFLSIDPYANGSSYSLDIPKALDSLEGEKTPRTPTMLLKGVTRTLSLVRKRSRPTINTASPQTVPRVDTSLTSESTKSNRNSMQSPATVVLVEHPTEGGGEQQQQQQQQQLQPQPQPQTPQTPVTYNDILRAVKKNAVMMGPPLPESDVISPTSPGQPTQKRGILSGLSARRRSMKLTVRP